MPPVHLDLPVVITGAAGLAGANLVRALLARGRTVRAMVHRDQRALEGLDVQIHRADLADPESLRDAFRGAGTVFHLAASISLRNDSWQEMMAVNVLGTRNVVEACLQENVARLIYFGSVHALQQEPFDRPLTEDSPRVTPSHSMPYERSKAAGEQEVWQGFNRGMDTIVIIPTAIVGPYDYRPSYLGEALLLLAQGRLPALVRGGYDWVDVRDVVSGAIQAEAHAAPGSSYILSGHWHTIVEVASMVAGMTGRRAPRLVLPIGLAELAEPLMTHLARLNGSQPLYTRMMLEAMRSNQHISHARAAQELGYAPRPLAESLNDTLRWFSSHDPRYQNLLSAPASGRVDLDATRRGA